MGWGARLELRGPFASNLLVKALAGPVVSQGLHDGVPVTVGDPPRLRVPVEVQNGCDLLTVRCD